MNFVKYGIAAWSLLMTSYASFSQIIIPGASEQPAWVFPLYFEDGSGAKDTVYIGYDENATNGWDANFGEISEKFDTSKFQVGTWLWSDSVFKVNIRDSSTMSYKLSFHKGVMPVTIYWEDSLFYSDALPFQDNGAAPRAKGSISCSDGIGGICPIDNFITMTDSIWEFESSSSIFSDSITFPFTGETNISVNIAWIKIVPWMYSPDGLEKSETLLSVYPNPFQDVISILHLPQENWTFELISVTGQRYPLVTNKGTGQNTTLDVAHIPSGIYQLFAYNNKNERLWIKRIVKTS